MNGAVVIDFSGLSDHGEAQRLAKWPNRLVAGEPHHQWVARHRRPGDGAIARTWAGTPARWRALADRDGFTPLLFCHLQLVTKDGTIQTSKADDSFLIPHGFEGDWGGLEATTKHGVNRNDAGQF